MRKGLLLLFFMLLGIAAGFFLKSITAALQPNYRWVLIFNETDCKISSASVLLPDRSVVVRSDQIKNSIYRYSSESDIKIPVLVSESQKFQIRLDFTNCPNVLGQPQKITSGSHIQAWFRNSGFTYATR
ncbi:MAG: hypothetical protein Q7T36_15825 [Fluviicoccus sp.]|uniref:hypothetical protein n=1 Tax=Fluviicoccus sp. TaxID=2003552 RepID=UPI00271B05A2|nr:hypothetical protein [Fluviicoccus sp.]MDO8331934.1 hypothetical protein [Fluviicoccus sp.]